MYASKIEIFRCSDGRTTIVVSDDSGVKPVTQDIIEASYMELDEVRNLIKNHFEK